MSGVSVAGGQRVPEGLPPETPGGRRLPPPRPKGDRNENPPGIGLAALIAEDFRTHGASLLSPGFWAVAVHRFGNWRMGVRSKVLRAPLTLAYDTAFYAVSWGFGIDLSYVVKLGRRVRLGHHGAMLIGARAIGDDVYIRHAVTMGLSDPSQLDAKPTIGDRVEIGPSACLVGDITVGHDSIIGANTVLADDLPPHSTVLGNPARPVDLRALADLAG
jgi:serine O-acetyltransferase